MVYLCKRPVCNKSHNAPVLYSTMHHFITEMCMCVSVTKWCIVGYLMHCGICETGLLCGIYYHVAIVNATIEIICMWRFETTNYQDLWCHVVSLSYSVLILFAGSSRCVWCSSQDVGQWRQIKIRPSSRGNSYPSPWEDCSGRQRSLPWVWGDVRGYQPGQVLMYCTDKQGR